MAARRSTRRPARVRKSKPAVKAKTKLKRKAVRAKAKAALPRRKKVAAPPVLLPVVEDFSSPRARFAWLAPPAQLIPVTYVKWLDLPGSGRRRYFLSEFTKVRNKKTYLLDEVAGRTVEVTESFYRAQAASFLANRRTPALASVIALKRTWEPEADDFDGAA